MTRPTDKPDWATSSTFSGGPVAGNANKAAPSGGMIAEGWDPTDPVAAEHLNYIVNNHGVWLSHLDDKVNGKGFGLNEDWLITGSNKFVAWDASGVADVIDDSANDSFGTLSVASNSGNHVSYVRSLVALPVGTKDMYFSVRMAVHTMSASGNEFLVGLYDAGTGDAFTLESNASGGSVRLIYGPGGGTSVITSSVLCTPGSTYHFFEAARIAGTVYYWADGVLQGSAADSTNFNPMKWLHETIYTSNDVTIYVDSHKLWVGR